MGNKSGWLTSLAKKVPQHITGSVLIGALFIIYSPLILANLSDTLHVYYLCIFGGVLFFSIIPISLNAIAWYRERNYLMKSNKIHLEEEENARIENNVILDEIRTAVNKMEG